VDTIRYNAQLAVLKVGYNNLGDEGAALIAGACLHDGKHHQNLSVLDMGFNGIGDPGAEAIALKIIAGNHILRTIFLSGNNIQHKGALSIAGAILHGCSLHRLHISANKLGPAGIKVLTGAIAESDIRRQQISQRQGGIITMVQPVALEDLRIEDTNMTSRGFIAVPNMLLTNSGLRVLSLSNNELDDQDMALMSQAISQNKALPLASLQLSHNKITCVGVECLMNAIWGSQTLREIKLDNNKIQDRGAQLCSVVLGSIHLEMLNLGFNRLTTVGIKAIMKSLSENNTLRALSMTGIPMDQNASKAVSYALAYNCSLEVFNVDSCCIGYSGQRHIVAGIVSNRNVRLRSLTGFPLGREFLENVKKSALFYLLYVPHILCFSSQPSHRLSVYLSSQRTGGTTEFLLLCASCGRTGDRKTRIPKSMVALLKATQEDQHLQVLSPPRRRGHSYL
jgi:Ran GTPase-activating protein (RanGAP) involved in mRNA processing and transport